MRSKLIGRIGVDAGLCWIGDPCYVLPDDASQNPGADWDTFCEELSKVPNPTAKSFNFQNVLGGEGVGVCVSTGYGDGFYPVEAKYNDEGLIAEVIVTFIDEDDED